MDTESEYTVRDGEDVAAAGKRLGLRPGETWDQLRARRLTEDATFRQDARGGDDEDGDGLDADAGAERDKMIARRMNASGVTRPADPAEPDAKASRRAMVDRKVNASKVKRGGSPTDPGPKPPISKSFAKAEESGEEEEGDDEESEEPEADAAAARKAMMDRRMGKTR
jgi:hypothetical protein